MQISFKFILGLGGKGYTGDEKREKIQVNSLRRLVNREP
jgi:hypothetical protein